MPENYPIPVNIHQNKSQFLSPAVPALGALFAILLLLIVEHENNTLSKHSFHDYTPGNASEIQYSLGPVTQDDSGNTWLQGWCVRKGVTYRYYNYGLDYTADAVYTNLHLCLVEGDSVYVIPTKLSDRDDIETVIGDGIDYRCSDFTAKIPKKQTHLLAKDNLGIIMTTPDGEELLYEIND